LTDIDTQPSVNPEDDPWINPDPQPGNFETLTMSLTARPDQIEVHEGNPDAKVLILVSVEGDDAKRLERIAAGRSQ